MIEVVLTEEEMRWATAIKVKIGSIIPTLHAEHSYISPVTSNDCSEISQRSWIALHRLVNKIYEPYVPTKFSDPMTKSKTAYLGCRISSMTKDYGDIRVNRFWTEDKVFVISSLVKGNSVKLLRYIKAGDAKNPDLIAPYMPSKCYLAPKSLTHPIEELIAILKGDTIETK